MSTIKQGRLPAGWVGCSTCMYLYRCIDVMLPWLQCSNARHKTYMSKSIDTQIAVRKPSWKRPGNERAARLVSVPEIQRKHSIAHFFTHREPVFKWSERRWHMAAARRFGEPHCTGQSGQLAATARWRWMLRAVYAPGRLERAWCPRRTAWHSKRR